MAEQFADLSHHNAVADLAAYARAGHTRVALKATEGTTFTDPAFVGRWREAGRAGLRRGAYHFARTVTDGAAQADRLLAAVDAAGPMTPTDWLVLDLEDNSSVASTARADQFAAEFCGRMVARGHPTGLLYTGRWYANPAGVGPDDVPAGWRRLWLADYTGASDTAVPLPTGWTHAQLAARQYTNAAAVPGITGPTDYSRVITDWDGEDMAAMTGPEFARAFLSALRDTSDTGQFGNDLWLQLRRIAAEGAKTQTAPLAGQLAALSGQVEALTAAVAHLAAAGGATADTDALTAAMRQAAHDGVTAALRQLVPSVDATEPHAGTPAEPHAGAHPGTQPGPEPGPEPEAAPKPGPEAGTP